MYGWQHPWFYLISIHTTTQVVTICRIQCLQVLKISIHTTTQVVTQFRPVPFVCLDISIHTTTQVVT